VYEKKSGADGDGGYTVPRRSARMITALRTNYSSASDLAEGLNKASAAVGANATFAAGTGTARAAAGKEQEEYIDPEDDEDDIFEDYHDPMIKVGWFVCDAVFLRNSACFLVACVVPLCV